MNEKILDSPISSDPTLFSLLVRLVLKSEADGTDGHVTMPVRRLSADSGLSYQSTRTALRKLIECGELTQNLTQKSTQLSTQQTTVLTICNFSSYTSQRKSSNAKTNAKTNAASNAMTSCVGEGLPVQETVVKKYKKFDLSFVDDALYDMFVEFLKMRDIVKPMKTDRAVSLAYSKLVKLSSEDSKTYGCSPLDAARMIIQQSIDNEWQGLFNVKPNNNYGTRNDNTAGYVQRTAADLARMHSADGAGPQTSEELSQFYG